MVTGRYAHWKPAPFGEKAFDAIAADLSQSAANVVALPLPLTDSVQDGPRMATTQEDAPRAKIA